MAKPEPFWMFARYDGHCHECDADIAVGERIVFDTDTRYVYCSSCGEDIAGDDPKARQG